MTSRREFLKISALLGAGMAAGLPSPGRAGVSAGPTVVESRGTDPAKIVDAAVDALGGMGKFVSPGQTVVVKPNIGWDRLPEQAANTSPEVLCQVVRLCLKAGAAKVKVFDRTCNDPRRCYATSGIAAALQGMNDSRVELSHVDDRRFRRMDPPSPLSPAPMSFYEDVLDAHRFINVPVAKHHGASVLTIGMKNLMGVLGGNRASIHRYLNEAIFDMNRVVRSHLTVVDMTRVLTANGPQGGRLEDVKKLDTVIASADVVAADAVAASLMGVNPLDLRYLKFANDAGLGVAVLDRINLRKVGA